MGLLLEKMNRLEILAKSLLTETSVTWTKASGSQRIEILKAAGVAIPETLTEKHTQWCRNLTLREKCALMNEILDNPNGDKAMAYRDFRRGNNDAKIITSETLPFSEACAKWGEARAASAIWETIHPGRRADISSKKWTLRPELDRNEIDAFCDALKALKV